MVLQANKQFHSINKYIISFITDATSLNDEQKEALVNEWKTSAGSKLKTTMHKSVTKTPTRVVSKYLYFCSDERGKILADNPGINIKECTCMLGRAWREFQANPDPERMDKYTKLFEADKARFEAEKKELVGDVPVKEKKRCKSAYLNYCSKRREENPKITIKELSASWAKVKLNPNELALYAPC